VGKPEGKRPLGRTISRWEVDIKMDIGEIGCDDMYWIELVQVRDQGRAIVNMDTNIWDP
jgi:hypothetical protein